MNTFSLHKALSSYMRKVSCKIKFLFFILVPFLPFAQNVTLSLLESSGELLKTIYDGEAAPGVTKVDFFKDGSMPTGVYLCRLTTPYQTQMIKFQIY